jgi:hypothetical protein
LETIKNINESLNLYYEEQNNENKPIEGEDFYYTPEGYKCFTVKYHLKRGYCCKVVAGIAPTDSIKKQEQLKNRFGRSLGHRDSLFAPMRYAKEQTIAPSLTRAPALPETTK